jgi:hypothetical protein
VDVKRAAGPLLLVVVLLAIAAAGYWLGRPAQAYRVACADPLAGCSFDHRGARVTVRFASRPTPLEAFTLSVRAPAATRVRAEFQMQGMEMGFNRYDLRPAGDGEFVASVTLPVCVSGRHDWTLYLDIDGSRYALPFSSR